MFSIFHIGEERGIVRQDRRRLGSDSYAFVWVRFGQVHLELAGKAYTCRKNELMLVPPGWIAFELKGDTSGIRDAIVVRFSPSQAEASGLLPLLARKTPLLWPTHMPELLDEKLLQLVNHWSERGPYYSVLCGALLTEALVLINREMDVGEKTPSAIQHTERMKSYIDDHYREKITKNELGGYVGISPNYAASLFRKVTGLTISDFVHRKRMKTAQYLLRHSQLTVQEISEQLGYSDPSYFNRTFKRTVGRLPSELIAERSVRE
ncbi:AraC family transcriptional regulator of arabinose operon [Paenibacillus phyllosphaerae]|uniref:AraC family transcriptional regulator of arabinose operon n=1 Tax=Paenibacillus phyllosphaerae TaxID=274593 RepID=A0A7W5B1B8_9BACL|nr:AraC family transcriptional regulator [Paenibacillus phyllosphaerae]MBB3112639.1 AraC family transcriptional regulator of arabinose operon [Paenibacillus phyllosphaerae]